MATRFIGRYKVIEELGRGGMGIVYRGEDPRLERPVAIKVLPPRKTSSPKALMRFQREARVCARLDHPYILKIYDYGEEESTYHIVMEYVEGITLREVIEETTDAETIDVAEMARLYGQICQAMEYAHALKITHRDIKPENIMVTREAGSSGSRKVKVMDFGLAVLEEMHDLTDPDAIMGTIAYFSPEQARGEPADQRSDIYSMGVVFYEMLTGLLPFDANNPSDMIRRHLETPPPSPRLVRPIISPILERIVLTCMRKDPADRYQNVRVIREDLEAFRAQANISAAHFWGSTGIVMDNPRPLPAVGGTMVEEDEPPASLSDEEKPSRPSLEPLPPRHLVPPAIAHAESQRQTDRRQASDRRREPRSPAEENSYESTSDELNIPPLASAYTPGMPQDIASRLGPPRTPPAQIPRNLLPPSDTDQKAAAGPSRVVPISGASPVASREWMEEAKDREQKGQWGRYQQFLNKLQKDEAAVARAGDQEIPTTVCGRCGIENPGDRKYCLDCGCLLEPSQYQIAREAANHNEQGLRFMNEGRLQEALAEFQLGLAQDPNLGETHKNLGVLWTRLGEAVKAEEEFKLAASLLKDDADLYCELASLYRQSGRKDEAIEALQAALRITPRNNVLRCQLAFLYSHRGKLTRAIEEYRTVLSYADDNLEAHLQLGIIYGSQNMAAEAITEFEAVVKLDPYNQAAYQWLGRLYAKRNRLGDAERAFQSALSLNPSDANAHSDLAAVYEAQRKEELALRELRQAISLDQGNLDARTRLASLYIKHHQPAMALQELEEVAAFHPKDARLHQQLGELYLKQNQLDKALHHFERTVTLDPTSADMHNRLGQVYLKKDYDALSIQEYQKAISLDPYNPDFHEDLGMAYYVNGSRDSAITEIKKAAILNSKNADYFKALGILCEEEGRVDEAVGFLKRAVELQPRDADVHALLGRLHGRQGLLNFAILEYQKALEYSPDNPLMMIYLARAFNDLGKPDQAVRYFQKAIGQMGGAAQTPENRQALARSYQDLGKAYLASGEVRRAHDVLESAMALQPEDARGLHYMALTQYAQGDVKNALDTMISALQREPQNADILADLARMYQLKGERDLALKAIRKAVRLHPERPAYYEQLGTILGAQGQYDQAAEALRAAMKLDPKKADHYYWKQAGLLMDQGNPAQAASAYQHGLAINDRNWRLYRGLARAFEELGRYEDALSELKKALALSLKDDEARKLTQDLERIRSIARPEVFADVVVAVPSRNMDRPFTYRIPPELSDRVKVGSMVEVPFHKRVLHGYVVDLHQLPPASLPLESLRDLLSVAAGEEFWGEDLLQIAHWMHQFYGCVMVDALHAIVPEPVRATFGRTKKRTVRASVGVVTLTDVSIQESQLDALDGEAPQARRLLAVLREHVRMPPAELLAAAHARREVLNQMKLAGWIRYRRVATSQLPTPDDPLRATGSSTLGGQVHAALTADQEQAVDAIMQLLAAGRPAVVLLFGVTGSGKTEVYLQALQKVTEQGKQGLVLVPEISLTPQAVDRYRARLGEKVAVLHSALTPAERVAAWWSLKEGRMSVALGARSCVFAPLRHASLFIVDEEHDASYKQENSPRYHARQVAIRRALHSGSVVVLGSATPSLESFYWASQERYRLLQLPNRVEGRELPAVEIVDLRRQSRAKPRALGSVLRERMRETLARNEQIMLLMNRRGFSSYLLCRECGAILRCPRCDISLTYHSNPPSLLCHYCLYEKKPPSYCPQCQGATLEYFGSGTQRVEEEVMETFPQARLLRMDRDTTRRMGDHRRLLEKFGRKEVQILLGTQMIAKGHDFPGVTLVGVVLADTALNMPDFRSAERTFSLLTQVAGRAGRGDAGGRVIIQTYNPEHAAVTCAARQDYIGFYEGELPLRRELGYPPFSHLVNMIFSGEDESAVAEAARAAGGALRSVGLQQLGPAPCAVARIHRKYRWHLTFKANAVQEIMPSIRNYLETRRHAGIQVAVDADPMSTM